MKFNINNQIIENNESTKITIQKKKIISIEDWIYNKNNDSFVKQYCPDYYTEDYVWNYFEIKIDFSKFPDKTVYLLIYPYQSLTYNRTIIPYLYSQRYSVSSDYNLNDNFQYDFDYIYDFTNPSSYSSVSFTYRCGVIMLRSDEDNFYIKVKSPCLSYQPGSNYYDGYISKINNQKDNLILGIGSKGNGDEISSSSSYAPSNLSIKQSQFIFINTEDKNLNNSFKLYNLIADSKCSGGSCFSFSSSHRFAWRFGIINYGDNDIDLNIASYKKDLTDTLDRLIEKTNGKVDGDASIEVKPEYEIKQILPTSKDIVTSNSFKYNGMNIKLSGNGEDFYYYHALIENTDNDNLFRWARNIQTGTYLPSIFEIDLGIELNNICQISFSPTVNYVNKNSSCSVKNYSLYTSIDHENWTLIKESVFENSSHKLYFGGQLFSSEDIVIQNIIPIRYIKIIISSIYPDSSISYNRSGFGHFRIYTNTKSLYNKEIDQSISNYKDESFNQVTTQSEWNQKTKEDKIILNKQASFNNPEITKIKNELNNFRIVTNHNNIPIYEK